jgi:hypothetical protein
MGETAAMAAAAYDPCHVASIQAKLVRNYSGMCQK